MSPDDVEQMVSRVLHAVAQELTGGGNGVGKTLGDGSGDGPGDGAGGLRWDQTMVVRIIDNDEQLSGANGGAHQASGSLHPSRYLVEMVM